MVASTAPLFSGILHLTLPNLTTCMTSHAGDISTTTPVLDFGQHTPEVSQSAIRNHILKPEEALFTCEQERGSLTCARCARVCVYVFNLCALRLLLYYCRDFIPTQHPYLSFRPPPMGWNCPHDLHCRHRETSLDVFGNWTCWSNYACTYHTKAAVIYLHGCSTC